VVALYGFMDSPDMRGIFALLKRKYDLDVDVHQATFFLGRETLLTTGRSSLSPTRKVLFAFLSRNAIPAPIFFKIPPGRVVELGMQVDL
jgi:KUP system potassium uptake protein